MLCVIGHPWLVAQVDEIDVVQTVDAVFDEVFAQVAARFPRWESRRQARLYARGLVSGVERKNSWELAEAAGDLTPDRMQKLLNVSAWDDAGVRADLRGLISRRFGGPEAVLVADETGFLKKGTKSAGVQRQYSGTAGRVENCQLGVFLALAGNGGRALIDAELYLPASWTDDRERCREAGIGDDVAFATKPQQAQAMIARALAEGVPFGWFTADEAYGDNGPLRSWLEEQHVRYVMAVSCDHRIDVAGGRLAAREAAAVVPENGWQTRSAGAGSKGPRLYHWALVATADPEHQLLIRRSPATGELAFYHCHAPAGATLADLVRVAGSRWSIEELFQTAKSHVGLDHYQVRRYNAWHRHMTLAMLAAGWLALTAATLHRGLHHLWTTSGDSADQSPSDDEQ